VTFTAPATTKIYTLSLHDALPIWVKLGARRNGLLVAAETELFGDTGAYASLGEKVMTRATTHSTGPYVIPHVKSDCYAVYTNNRSEEHTSELQSRENLVCRLLLEK